MLQVGDIVKLVNSGENIHLHPWTCSSYNILKKYVRVYHPENVYFDERRDAFIVKSGFCKEWDLQKMNLLWIVRYKFPNRAMSGDVYLISSSNHKYCLTILENGLAIEKKKCIS